MEKMNIGEAIKELRKAQNITKEQLSEKTGISVSHLEKIESGARRPGIDTYHRLLNMLNADIVIHKQMETVQEKCVIKIQEIILSSSEAQAIFMTRILESISQNIGYLT